MTWLLSAWSWFVGTKIGRWMVGIALTLAALAAALAVAFLKGKHAQADKDEAQGAQSLAEAAQEVVKRANDAQEIENAIAKQPDAGTQQVGTAKPGTSAGELREHWMRPDAAQDDKTPDNG